MILAECSRRLCSFADKMISGSMRLDINADLEGLFNWNVKQLFINLTAELNLETTKFNQVVLWGQDYLSRSKGP